MSATIEYKTRTGRTRLFDISDEACDKFGFRHNERVTTPRGPATVIGICINGNGFRNIWFHADCEKGAIYWDNGRDHHSLLHTVGIYHLYNEKDNPIKSTDPSQLFHLTEKEDDPIKSIDPSQITEEMAAAAEDL